MAYWFRVDANFRAHPKVAIVRRVLKCSKMEALGIIVSLWALAAEHSVAGDLSELPLEFIEEWFAPVKGDVIGALHEAGYLDGMVVHDWLDHNGQLEAWQRRKQADAERKRLIRSQQKVAEKQTRPQSVRGQSADASADKVRTVHGRVGGQGVDGPVDENVDLYRQEQEQEQKQKTPPNPPDSNPEAVALLTAYCAEFGIGTMTAGQRSRWLSAAEELVAIGADTEEALERARRLRDSWPSWRGDLPAVAQRWAELAEPEPEPDPPPAEVLIGNYGPPPKPAPLEIAFAAQLKRREEMLRRARGR